VRISALFCRCRRRYATRGSDSRAGRSEDLRDRSAGGGRGKVFRCRVGVSPVLVGHEVRGGLGFFAVNERFLGCGGVIKGGGARAYRGRCVGGGGWRGEWRFCALLDE